jgi:putative redox protein
MLPAARPHRGSLARMAGERECGARPTLASMEKRVDARWVAGTAMDFEARNEAGAMVVMGSLDSPEFRPAALVLAGLAGCTGMDAISIMAKKRQQVERYEIEAVGQQREEHPRFFTSIVVTHSVEGRSIEDAAVHRAIELSARKYCIVGANLASGDTSINHRVRITDENGERFCDCLTIGPRGKGLAHYEEAEAG